MRLLHLASLYAPHHFGGAEVVVQRLAERQATAGITVGVAHLAPVSSPPSRLNGVDLMPLAHRNPLWVMESGKYPGPIRKLNKVATIFNVLTARDFAQVLDRFSPDVLHTHSMAELTPWMWSAAKRRGIPIVHTLHDFDLMCIRTTLFKDGKPCKPPHRACQVLSYEKRRHHHAIDHVVGVSQTILDVHLQHGLFTHLSPAARHVIWNPVEPIAGVVRQPRSDVLVFGFLGRPVPEKGVDILIEACRRMVPGGWQLRVGGRPPREDSDLRARAAGMPITFEGYVQPRDFLGGIDILVAPAVWSEPFGLTTVEAMTAGIPVLGSDLGGVGEVIRSVDPSWLVPPGDPAMLARRMSALVAAGRQDRSLPGEEVAKLREKTATIFVAAQYESIYDAARSAVTSPSAERQASAAHSASA